MNKENFMTREQLQADAFALDAVGYDSLMGVLRRAFSQAAHGKGAERHAQGMPFDQQPMQELISLYGVGFALGQAAKKAQESQRLPHDRAVAELLGAINYLAGAVIAMERGPQAKPVAANDNLAAHAHMHIQSGPIEMHAGKSHSVTCCHKTVIERCQGCPYDA